MDLSTLPKRNTTTLLTKRRRRKKQDNLVELDHALKISISHTLLLFMAIRRRGLLKYLFLIPAFWFGAIIVFSLRTDSLAPSRNDIQINVVDRKDPPSFVDRIIGVLPFKNHPDHDHPAEEREKAAQQAQEMKGVVQVVAPEMKDAHNDPKTGGPGEMGNPVRIDKEKLSKEERQKYDDGWKNNAFNQYVSDMISLRRNLADIRDPESVVAFVVRLSTVFV